MLPLHHSPHSLARYTVKSADVLSQNRVIVEDAEGRTIWFKERTLYEDEVVDTIFQNTSPPSRRWTIHTPTRGWYLRMRSPAFPPGSFVHVKPVPAASDVVTGTLQLGCQTLVFDYAELATSTPRSSLSLSQHNDSPSQEPLVAAPTPPIITMTPPDARHSYPPKSSEETKDLLAVPASGPLPQPRPRLPVQISHFVLTPVSRHRARQQNSAVQQSLLSRILPLSLHEPQSNSYTSAFELTVRPPVPGTPIPHGAVPVPPPRAPPLLTFIDDTPVFSVRTTGTIELNTKLEARLGVDRSFWIAAALAYIEFLEERDAFLASEESA